MRKTKKAWKNASKVSKLALLVSLFSLAVSICRLILL
nr:MAG TPA: hypothetical protein [Caudoviricetes sp.]